MRPFYISGIISGTLFQTKIGFPVARAVLTARFQLIHMGVFRQGHIFATKNRFLEGPFYISGMISGTLFQTKIGFPVARAVLTARFQHAWEFSDRVTFFATKNRFLEENDNF